jgi:hypothetical protein
VRLPQQRAEDVPFVVELRDGRPGVTAIKATSVYTASYERQADVAVAFPPNYDSQSEFGLREAGSTSVTAS